MDMLTLNCQLVNDDGKLVDKIATNNTVQREVSIYRKVHC